VTVAVALILATTAPAVAQDAPTTPRVTPTAPASDSIVSGGEPLAVVNGQILAVVPFAGGLGLPVKVGTSGSRIRGTTATATSGTLDLGLLGDLALLAVSTAPTLGRLGIDTSKAPAYIPLPRPVTADSRDVAEVDNRVTLDAVRLGPAVVGGGHETARAPEGGPASSRTELGDLRIALGVGDLLLAGGVAETEATATQVTGAIAFGEMSLRVAGAPLVTLRGLEWRIQHVLGAEPTGGFSLGGATVAGIPYASPGLEALQAAISQINALLVPSGTTLELPKLTATGLSPLSIVVKDAPSAFEYINPIYSLALASAINEIEAAVVGGVPETGLAVTVANVLLAALTGRGGARVDIGGLTTSVGVTPSETFSYGSGAEPTGSAPASVPAGTASAPSGAAGIDFGPTASPVPVSTSAGPTGSPDQGRNLVQTVSSVVGEDLPGALVLALGGAAIIAAWLLDRRRITAWAAGR
jgi:hypothetical protein